jgi:glycosyltransferase involved in cell wall biosynthesis
VEAGRGRDAYELFSTPYSRYSPESHPLVAGADAVHLHWVSGFVDYPRFFRGVGRPCVWTLHDQAPYLGGFHYERDRQSAPGLAALEREFLEVKRRALLAAAAPAVVVGNSAWNTDCARRSGFFPEATRFETVYYPLDCSVFSPAGKAAAKGALGIPEGEFTVGFASTSVRNPRKGFGDLVEALALLGGRGQAPPFGLLSFGRPPDPEARARVRAPWRELGFVGDDAAKRNLYSAMDCFVIPSRAEAFGQTAIEAMACGTAVIGSDVGGITEALGGGQAGLLFTAGASAELASQIARLASSPGEARSLAEKGRSLVVGRHAPERNASAYAAIYAGLTMGGGRAGR